jgi:hypothetical protein
MLAGTAVLPVALVLTFRPAYDPEDAGSHRSNHAVI